MKQTNTRAMVETAFVSTIVAMLTIIGAVMPFSAFLATMVAPAGISIIGIRWGSRYSCTSSIVAFILVTLFLGPLIAMSTILVYSLPSIFLGEAFRANWSFRKLILVPAAVLLGMGLLQLVVANSFASVDFISLGQNVNNELKEAMIESIRQQSAPQEQIDTMIQQLNYSFAQAERMMLSLWFCACSIITYIMAKLVSYIGRRTNTVHRELPPMATWRMPIWGAGVLAIGIIIIYGLSYIGYNSFLLIYNESVWSCFLWYF